MNPFNHPLDPRRGPAFSNPDDSERPDPAHNTPSRIFARDPDDDRDCGRVPCREQVPVDLIDEESMESFPCSDPPSYSRSHS